MEKNPGKDSNYLCTGWLGELHNILDNEEDEELQTPPPSPTNVHDVTPEKYLGMSMSVHEGQPQKFADVSSTRFSKVHLDQAKIDFNIDADLSFTVQQEELLYFPWLIFDVSGIPVNEEQHGYLPARDRSKVTKVREGIHKQQADGWAIDHTINEQWRSFFTILRANFLTIDINSKNDAKIETMAEQLCHYFGFTVSRYYVLHQYPTFPVHIKDNDPIEVRPDVVAGHWRLNPDGEMKCFFAETSPVADFLHEVIAVEGWTPSASRVFVPSFIAECKSRDTETNDVCKLLIELAIIRDMEKLLFTTNRRYTLGVYCLGLNWRFYVLQDSDSPDFKYSAHHIYTHKLTKSYLSWLQLGVILQRLAAYNLSRTHRLELIPKEEQLSLIDDIQRLAVKADMDRDAKKKRKKKDDHTKKYDDKDEHDDHGDDKGDKQRPRPSQPSKHTHTAAYPSSASNTNSDPPSKSNTKTREKRKRIWLEVNDAVITREIYTGSFARVCIATTTAGYEVAVKLIKSESEALYEATMLYKLQGRHVVKLLRFDELPHESRLIMEKLNPLPDFSTREQLQSFIWELLLALAHVHSRYCVHGDVKHSNIMMTEDNHVKLIDFAFAATLHSGQTLKYKYGGTHVYLSPERLCGAAENNKIDVFAAGLVCAEKMYNIRIDSFATREKLIEKIKAGEISGLAEPESVDLISAMLTSDPLQRPSAETCLEHPFLRDGAMDESD